MFLFFYVGGDNQQGFHLQMKRQLLQNPTFHCQYLPHEQSLIKEMDCSESEEDSLTVREMLVFMLSFPD